MILVDFSQLFISSVFSFQEDMRRGSDPNKVKDILRYTSLQSLLFYKNKFSGQFGNLVICTDSQMNWRKDIYPDYKANRKGSRDSQDVNWRAVFEAIDSFSQDLKKFFPWKVVGTCGAEGDDVIATLTKYLLETDVKQDGLVEESNPVLIVSADHDFCQLHTTSAVKQYSPIQKKWVVNDNPRFLDEKIVKGDAGDGVPSALCQDDWFVNHEGRAPRVTKKVLERLINREELSESEESNLLRNKILMDFRFIPEQISSEIISMYKAQSPKVDLYNIMQYLMNTRNTKLLERIQEFK